jgi:hypothetical protein
MEKPNGGEAGNEVIVLYHKGIAYTVTLVKVYKGFSSGTQCVYAYSYRAFVMHDFNQYKMHSPSLEKVADNYEL